MYQLTLDVSVAISQWVFVGLVYEHINITFDFQNNNNTPYMIAHVDSKELISVFANAIPSLCCHLGLML